MSRLPFDILVITDRSACTQVGKTVVEAVAQILQSPLSPRLSILVRDKEVPQSQVASVIKVLQPMTQGAGAKLFVHTHVELALEFGLDGLHLAGNGDLERVRSQLPSSILLGISRHRQDPLDDADIGLADYATISPVYSPTSKPEDTRETLGIEGLRACVGRSIRPLVALGGIQPGRVGAVVGAGEGCAAIALCGAILQTKNPKQLLKQLCNEIDTVYAENNRQQPR